MPSWDALWRKRAEDWIYSPLEKTQVPDDALDGVLNANTSYVSVTLKSAHITDVRKGLKTFYGTVHSHIKLEHRSGKDAEFNVVTTPKALQNVDASNIDRVIQINKPLLGPVPYVGEGLDIEVGLFSVVSSDLTAPYLKLLEDLSEVAGISYISSALPFAGPIIDGINLLSGASNNGSLEIGLCTTLKPVKLGYYVVIRAPKGELDVTKLKVDPKDYKLLDSDGNPFLDYPYLLVEIRSASTRDDWSSIPEIALAYKKVQDEYRRGKKTTTLEAIDMFKRTALTCNDLIIDHARALSKMIDEIYNEYGPPPRITKSASNDQAKQLPELSTYNLYDY